MKSGLRGCDILMVNYQANMPLPFNRAKLSWRMEVCPVPKHDISQLAAEVLEQVLDGNKGGMEGGGGTGEGRGGG